jgi:hypothetical protein
MLASESDSLGLTTGDCGCDVMRHVEEELVEFAVHWCWKLRDAGIRARRFAKFPGLIEAEVGR